MKTDRQISVMKTGYSILLILQKAMLSLWLIMPVIWFYFFFSLHPELVDRVINKEGNEGSILVLIFIGVPFLIAKMILSAIENGINIYRMWVDREEIASIPANRHVRWWAKDSSKPSEVVLKFKNDFDKLSWGIFKCEDIPKFEYGRVCFLNRDLNYNFEIKAKYPNTDIEFATLPPHYGQYDRRHIQIDGLISQKDGRFLLQPNDEVELRLYGCKIG